MNPILLLAIVAIIVAVALSVRWLRGPRRVEARDPDLLVKLSTRISEYYKAAGHPSDIIELEDFSRGVGSLSSVAYTTEDLLSYYTGDNPVTAAMALEAIGRRGKPESTEQIISNLNGVSNLTRYFALRTIANLNETGTSLIGRLLVHVDESWLWPPSITYLKELVRGRVEGGETPSFGSLLDTVDDDKAEEIETIIRSIGPETCTGLSTEIKKWREVRVDKEYLQALGRLWDGPESSGRAPVIPHESLLGTVQRIEEAIRSSQPRSVLIVGEGGVGKSAAIQALAERLRSDGWSIFEAGHAELIAGMIYMGQFEERLRDFLKKIGGGRRVLWLVPRFQTLQWAGKHAHSPVSALDLILPYVERGQVTIVGEIQPTAYEKLIQSKPRCKNVFETVRVHALPREGTLALAEKWVGRHSVHGSPPLLSTATLSEAWHLAQQFLGDRSAPGNLLELLNLTHSQLLREDSGSHREITLDDLIVSVSQLTGLPSTILDDRQNLDLHALRVLFEKRVIGQPEAVSCLVERVAMIKAGVTDPNRPFGVFLFAGPTGTGKTEIAKTLAEYLFGSPNKMIRLDMSEFQEDQSLGRILGESRVDEASGGSGGALVDLIRKQPFSVVLLDEFEKAHPRVWDVFLQLFDDGRLTDRRGNTSDFRHSIIILTSNLGGVIPSGMSLGFTERDQKFSPAAVERAVTGTFRKEFLNRLDRTVVFRPLSRDSMRTILNKELASAFNRRGLRSRSWAVEWDDAAVEILLKKGFTADLGARPLRRSIEQHLLAPLSMTIVNRLYPEGDQFLFIRADGDRLKVEFVDPDAPETGAEPLTEETTGHGSAQTSPSPQHIVLTPRGGAADLRCLQGVYDLLLSQVEDPSWRERKSNALSRTHDEAFWTEPDRITVLGWIEYMDRFESGVRSAGSLLDRLSGSHSRRRERLPRALVKRLAEQIHLLEHAARDIRDERFGEALLLVEACRKAGNVSSSSNGFARRIADMYRAWAQRRRMELTVLEESNSSGTPYRWFAGISGFAAYSLLVPEDGIHVLEKQVEGRKSIRTAAVRVHVAAQPVTVASANRDGSLEEARDTLVSQDDRALSVTRRYREEPSPLVRDAARGWRTGRLDRVLDGEFDLFTAVGQSR